MTIKTELDVKRAQKAIALSAELAETGISVRGGGSKGPFSVTGS